MKNCKFFLFILLAVFVFSCKKNNTELANPLSDTDTWILDSLRRYYYWSDQLPSKPSSNPNPGVFFKSLLNPIDRFSFITDPDNPPAYYSSYGYYGFDYAIIEYVGTSGSKLLGVVNLVVPGSPSDYRGMKRGMMFTQVNEIDLNSGSMENINLLLKQGKPLTLSLVNFNNGSIAPVNKLTVSASSFSAQPVFLTKTFSSNGNKAGYIYYDSFNGQFDTRLLDSLAKLKTNGITDLIIDLRYNPGGDVSSAAKLAGTIAPVEQGQPFVIYQANRNGGRSTLSFQQAMNENNYAPSSFSFIRNRRLNLQSVIILTTGATASSAELLINNLKPYIKVIQIGETTIGKDMASFSIADQRNPKQIKLVLHPLIYKLYNANGAGDYQMGIDPDYRINEYETLPVKPLGDPEEALLKKALELSVGFPVTFSASKKNNIVKSEKTLFESASVRNEQVSPVNFLGNVNPVSFKRAF